MALIASPRWTPPIPCTAASGPHPPCRSAGSRTRTTAPARRTRPRRSAGSPDRPRHRGRRPGARRRHRQAHRGAGPPGPPGGRHRPGRRDAAAPGPPAARHAGRDRRRRADPAARPVGRHRGRRAVLPLVGRRARAAGDRPGAPARRAPVPDLEPARRADPLGTAPGCPDRHPGAAERPDARAAVLEPVRLRGDHQLPVLAAARPAAAARPGAVPLQHRDDDREPSGSG